jgi:glycosyltransferase involved in cell wall biosynthesis
VSAGDSVRSILQVHTRYRQRGGEDRVVEAEKNLLESAGIAVQQVVFDNADLREGATPASDVRLAASAVWSRSSRRRVEAAIARRRPDAIHVHNTFAAASPSVFAAAVNIPVVQTLHNYRLVCPVATVFRDGRPCTDCVGRAVPWPGVLHACVRGSHAQSAVTAAAVVVQRRLGRRGPDRYIALTSFQRKLMIDGGLDADSVAVIPNFLEPDPGAGSEPRSGVLYVGRLVTEKGIDTLLAAASMRPGVVRVVGDGPLRPAVDAAARRGDVEYVGPLDAPAVLREMARAVALVMPSIWFEGFPLTVLESYASGTPVIASGLGSLIEVVGDGATGMHAAPGDPVALAERIGWALEHTDAMRQMGSNARRAYELRYRGASHLEALLDTYAAAAS